MRAPLALRLLMIPLVWLPVGLVAWIYVSTHDLARSLRELQAGPHGHLATRSQAGPRARADRRRRTRSSATTGRRAPHRPCCCWASRPSSSSSAELLHRRARARATARWELRLGRDDLAEPYHVQEAFEGITGAISIRWYERLWRGPDHFALEIHRLPDLSIRFTVAAPTELVSAIRGPLEDLYPDVELIEVDGRPDWAELRRAAQEARVVRPVDPDDPQLRARVRRVARRDALAPSRTSSASSSCSRPAPGCVHRRARRLLKRRERALQHADHARPRRARHRLHRRSQGAQGRARDSNTARCCTSTCASPAATAQSVRRVAGLFSQLRSENELVRREMRLRRRASTPRGSRRRSPTRCPGWRAGVLSTSELATLWQLPRARVKHAAAAARDRAARDRAAGDRARRRRGCCCATSAARSRSPPPIASTATR